MILFLRRGAGLSQGLRRGLHRPSWLLLGMLALFLALSATEAPAQDYQFTIVASGLRQPAGLAASALGDSDTLYFTEIPQASEQGLGTNGANTISKLTLSTGDVTVLNRGDPEPMNIVQDAKGNLYWTSRAAGVIMMRSPDGNTAILLWGLDQPVGIALDAAGENLYYTELPTFGVGSAKGGENKVWSLNLATQFRTLLNSFEPAPTDIVVAKNGDIYYTCQSAGVIIHQPAGTPAVNRTIWAGLQSPMGIALDLTEENLYFTEVPTPNVSGANGGRNTVSKFNLATQAVTVIYAGDPFPNSLAVTPNGNIYWTSSVGLFAGGGGTAGVIIEAKAKAGN